MEGRIIVDPKILAGKPVIRGTRIPVYLVLNLLAHGKRAQDIIEEYPELSKEDIVAALVYASALTQYETKRLETAR